MGVISEPFRASHPVKVRDSFTVNVNKEERKMLEWGKKRLEQVKDSTALKQLATIGAKTLQSQLIGPIVETVLDNRRKNARLGIVGYDGEKFANEGENDEN